MTDDGHPQLVHIEVDGPPEQVDEWTRLVQENPLDGYEFVVTDETGTVRSVVRRDELVADIADAVAERRGEFEAFRAGFMQSAEGFNGEYTPSGADVDAWLRDRYEEWVEGRDTDE